MTAMNTTTLAKRFTILTTARFHNLSPISVNSMDYICLKESTHCEFYDLGKCHNVEDCAYAIAEKIKQSPFKHREAIQLAHDMERNNTYTNALIAERNQARLDCAVAEANHMRTLERFLEAQERITELTAERDALAKSICVVSEPIETIQPRGITE